MQAKFLCAKEKIRLYLYAVLGRRKKMHPFKLQKNLPLGRLFYINMVIEVKVKKMLSKGQSQWRNMVVFLTLEDQKNTTHPL